MFVQRIATVVFLTLSLPGCFYFGDKFTCRNRSTIEVNGLSPPKACPILVDPSLKPQVNETTEDEWDFFFRMDTKQRIVINSASPLKLVPITQEEADRLMAAEKNSQPGR